MCKKQAFIPVIMCGGAGSRLWPVSRAEHPKPFIKLSDQKTLLQHAFERATQQTGVSEVLTVTSSNLVSKIIEQYGAAGKKQISTSFLIEPMPKNTAAGIAAASLLTARKYGEDALVLVLAADHLIENDEAFHTAVQQAKILAEKGKIVTFGIRPTHAATGYGYIHANGNQVIKFIEKPTLVKAESLFKSGDYFWNSGIFCFRVSSMIKEFLAHSPELYEKISECMHHSTTVANDVAAHTKLDPEFFADVQDISIDYAILECSKNVAVVPCELGWRDIGSWDSLAALTPKDPEGNQLNGITELHEVNNCYIQTDNKLVAAVGVSDLIIVNTNDAVLVADKKKSQDVKHIYQSLKAKNNQTYRIHKQVYRPWGNYTVLDEGEFHKIKRIEVKPHASLSLQLHQHRSEHWVVTQGEATVVNGEENFVIKTNESTFIAAGHKHRLSNETNVPLVIIEVQSGTYVGEDDIVRFEDDYGRC